MACEVINCYRQRLAELEKNVWKYIGDATAELIESMCELICEKSMQWLPVTYLPAVEGTFLHLGVNLQTKRHALNLLCCFIVVVQVAMI